jgi:UPF0755 protein
VARVLLRFSVFVVVLAVVGAAGWMVYDRVLGLRGSDLTDLDSAARKAYISTHRAEPAGDEDTPVHFVVELGETGADVAERLLEQSLIRDPRLFRYYLVENDLTIEAGEFVLSQTMTPFEIAHALQFGRAGEVALTIPEGRRMEEIANLAAEVDIDPTEFLALVTSPTDDLEGALGVDLDTLSGRPPNASLEGYLFPDTYLLSEGANASDLVERLLSTFVSKISQDDLTTLVEQEMTLHEAIILASIVEREAVLPEERPVIASVYRNRIDAGIKLDADPTVQYALGRQGDWWPEITAEDYLSVQSPWNTYLNPGLPPGPIANPGIDAIRAVLAPSDTPYLFFMRDCQADDGSHVFAATQQEHLENYARCYGQ